MNVVELKDIATQFASRTKMGDIEAEAFVNSMFSVIRQGLEADRQVKIRGFGTFKVIDVEARESVSVNTGERVVIESHRKVTFTPDATMKELVNKPFSLFNTVALNDGVEFDDVDVETPTETDLQEQDADVENQAEPVVETEEPVVEAEEAVAEAEEPVTETEESETETETATVAPEEGACDGDNVAEEAEKKPADTREEPVGDNEELAGDGEEPADATEEAENENQSDAVLPSKCGKKVLKAVLYCLLTLALMGASYFVGIHYGRFCAGGSCIFSHEEAAPEPVTVAVDARNEASKDVQKADTAKPSVPDTVAEKAVGTPEEAISEPEKAVAESGSQGGKAESQVNKAEKQDAKSAEVAAMMQTAAGYADKDVRVRTGAYCIVGTDRTVTVRQGESLAALSKRELGSGMDCYVETFNGLRPDAVLKAGQTVRIPKLMHKKALRRLAK